jgi:DNA invertase Pin-like site-specific DNA recombinase
MCKVYGYCRISTAKQSLERQIENISKAYNNAEIITETYTGTKTDRPEWSKLKARAIKKATQGEQITIVFDSVSRMSRNATEGFTEYKELFESGVTLVFLKEHHIDTDTYKNAMNNQIDMISDTGDTSTDKLINTIIGAIKEYQLALAEKQIQLAFEQAEKEVSDLQIRTKEGMKASGAAEKISKSKTGTTYTVKKSENAKQIIAKHYEGFGGSLTVKECIELAGISRNTFFKLARELKEEK